MASQEVLVCRENTLHSNGKRFFSSKCGDWTCDAETQKFLRINFHARCCDRFMPGKLWGKYSVGSDSWCRANVRGGICRWRTCMRCFDPDGLGQYSGDRWGKRKEVSCSHHRFSLFLTHLQPCSICYIFFFTYTARSALHTASDLQSLLTSLHSPFPQLCHIPLSMSEIVYFRRWMNDNFFLRGCRGGIVGYGTTYHVHKHLYRTYSSDKALALAAKAEEKSTCGFCRGN